MKRRDRRVKREATPIDRYFAEQKWTAADYERAVWLPTVLRQKRRKGA